MSGRCDSCGQHVPTDREVVVQCLIRAMPKRIPKTYDAEDLADEAIAALRSLGWAKCRAPNKIGSTP